MLRTKLLVSSLDEIPREWVFEYYLKLPVKLTGQDEKIKSVFKSDDKVPSLCIYYSKPVASYRFKCFSSGYAGDGVTLIQHMFKLTSRGESAHKIIQDYNQYTLSGNKEDYSLREFKVQTRYKVSKFEKRSWMVHDQKFWNRFYIGSALLEEHFVFPLSSYTMTKEIEGVEQELVINGRNIYGFFRKDGTLYKIYQPYVKDNKFIKVRDYVQGLDQLTMKVPYLVICSSLKDLMFFKKLGFKNAEAIAPDSENVLIPDHIMQYLLPKYKGTCVLFDNDEAGIKCMAKYKEKYNLPPVLFTMAKDLSDAGEKHGLYKVREGITPLLKATLNTTT